MGAAPWKSPPVTDPATSRKQQQMFADYQQFMAMQRMNSAKAAGNDDTKPDPWAKWTCWNCKDANLARHRWCVKCHADKKEDPNLNQSKGKGKGKGKDVKGKPGSTVTDAGSVLPAAAPAAAPKDGAAPKDSVAPAEAPAADDPATLHLKALATMGLRPAPTVARARAVPTASSKTRSQVCRRTGKGESERGVPSRPGSGRAQTRALCHLANGADGRTGTSQGGAHEGQWQQQPDRAKATRDFLQARADGAPAASEAAQERHQGHLAALTTEIARLQEIHAHKVKDFAEAQTAFAARLVEDKEALKATMESIAKTIRTDGTTPMEVSVPNVTQTAEDLLQTLPGQEGRHPRMSQNCRPNSMWANVFTVAFLLGSLYVGLVCSSSLCHLQGHGSNAFSHPHPSRAQGLGRILGATAGDIKEEQHIPHTMHKILMHVVDQRKNGIHWANKRRGNRNQND